MTNKTDQSERYIVLTVNFRQRSLRKFGTFAKDEAESLVESLNGEFEGTDSHATCAPVGTDGISGLELLKIGPAPVQHGFHPVVAQSQVKQVPVEQPRKPKIGEFPVMRDLDEGHPQAQFGP